MSGPNWLDVINLGNSIIGVSILAMPFCFKQCGLLLGMILLFASAWMTNVSSKLLLKAGIQSRRRSYEFLAYFTTGHFGKLLVELGCIGLNVGSCVAFFVVMGDLGPAIVSKMVGWENSWQLRSGLMIVLAFVVALPLGLRRNVESLSHFSALSICFYIAFITYMFVVAFPTLLAGSWTTKVNYWRIEGLFQSLPICSLAFACQTQLFIMYDSLPEPSLKTMSSVVSGAINLCTAAYLLTGFFGYVAFSDQALGGDVLTLFPRTLVSDIMKLGFVLSIAISFPLVIFPCRAAVFTLFFPQKPKSRDDFGETNRIPDFHFRVITIAIVLGTLIIGILVPNVEFVLGMCGATMGTLISYILPAIFFIKVSASLSDGKGIARFVLVAGCLICVVSTYTTWTTQEKAALNHLNPQNANQLADAKLNPEELQKAVEAKPGENRAGVEKQEDPDRGPDKGKEAQIESPDKQDESKAKHVQDSVKKDEKRQEPPIPHAPPDEPVDQKSDKKNKENEKEQKDEVKNDVLDNDKEKKNKDDEIASDLKKEDMMAADEKAEQPVNAGKDEVAKDTDIKDKKGSKQGEAVDKEELDRSEREAEKVQREEDKKKQKELIKKLEEQQESQKKLIEEEKKILEELKLHRIEVHRKEGDQLGIKEDISQQQGIAQQQGEAQPGLAQQGVVPQPGVPQQQQGVVPQVGVPQQQGLAQPKAIAQGVVQQQQQGMVPQQGFNQQLGGIQQVQGGIQQLVQPAMPQQQPAGGQQQPVGGQHQPALIQQPVVGQQQQVVGQQQPPEGQQQPIVGQQQPFGVQQQPVVDQQQPFGGQQQPVVGQQQPAWGQQLQIVGQQQPAGGQQQPVVGQQQPAGGQQQPVVAQQQPAGGQQQPVVGQQQPAEGQQQPVVGQQQPAGGQQQQVGAQQQQVVGQQQPALGQQDLVGQQQPVLNQQQQNVAQQQPALGQQQPALHQQQPALGQQQPVVKQEQPVVGQQQPVVKQDQPVVAQGLAQNQARGSDGKQEVGVDSINKQSQDGQEILENLGIDLPEKEAAKQHGEQQQQQHQEVDLRRKKRDIGAGEPNFPDMGQHISDDMDAKDKLKESAIGRDLKHVGMLRSSR